MYIRTIFFCMLLGPLSVYAGLPLADSQPAGPQSGSKKIFLKPMVALHPQPAQLPPSHEATPSSPMRVLGRETIKKLKDEMCMSEEEKRGRERVYSLSYSRSREKAAGVLGIAEEPKSPGIGRKSNQTASSLPSSTASSVASSPSSTPPLIAAPSADISPRQQNFMLTITPPTPLDAQAAQQAPAQTPNKVKTVSGCFCCLFGCFGSSPAAK